MKNPNEPGYSHQQSTKIILNSLMISIIAIQGVVYFGYGNHQSIFEFLHDSLSTFLNIADYWNQSPDLCPNVILLMCIYMISVYSFTVPIISSVTASWPLPSITVGKPAPDSHVFLIVAHNSSKTGIDETLRALLKLVKPHQIYVADNGSSKEEEAATDDLCNSMSEEYYLSDPKATVTYIQVGHLSKGNKSFAQYSAVYYLNEEIEKNKLNVEYVTIIDDDVIVPAHWNYQSIEKLFEDQTKVALAYPLCVANSSVNLITRHQDIEYLTAACDRVWWDLLGNQLFCNGAMATWKILPLLNVLKKHSTCFNGEDLEMGYILHSLIDIDIIEGKSRKRIGLVTDCIIPTIAPTCIFHWFDFIPAYLKKKYGLGCEECSQHSFFNQRVRSWDCTSHSFIFKYINIITNFKDNFDGKKWIIKLICLIRLLNIGRDMMLTGAIIYTIHEVIFNASSLAIVVFWLDCVLHYWSLMILLNLRISHILSPMKKRFQPEMIFFDPIVQISQYIFMNAFVSILYSAFRDFWRRFPRSIEEQLKDSKTLEIELHTAWYKSLAAHKIHTINE
ncbi:hypothetical protein BC833DRAFT_618752 [Globomyces pollinis-pini]|nr:hypothetical protein BC833DRAFT_618752 [Globomyces pollinis-pini]